MALSLEVLFTPAEFDTLARRDLRQTVCVVFDVLRATSTMVTALANGAAAILPVAEIAEALEVRGAEPNLLLAGERGGLRIGPDQTGSVGFDFGNSPREFTSDRVRDRKLVMTTTNGTRALRACHHAKQVLIGSFLNLSAIADMLAQENPSQLLLVCSGTFDQIALEDALAAGALCERIWTNYQDGEVADSARMARRLFQVEREDLLAALAQSRNARRLLGHPELQGDVRFCLRLDVFPLVAQMEPTGWIKRLPERPS